MALFVVHTGAREHVVAELRWSWEIKVNELGASVFLVPGEFTKNDTTCLVVLNCVAQRVIESRRGKHETYVFTYRGKPVTRMHNSAWKRAWLSAGFPVGTQVLSGPHQLRHTFARRLRLADVLLETRIVLMHHIDGDITIHYSPAEVSELLEAVEKLTQVEGVAVSILIYPADNFGHKKGLMFTHKPLFLLVGRMRFEHMTTALKVQLGTYNLLFYIDLYQVF